MKLSETVPEDMFRQGRLIPVSCNRDCGAGCPLAAVMEEGGPVKIIDNPLRDPGSAGCIRGYRALETAAAPDRLTSPLKRTGPRGSGRFQRVSWDEALDEIADKLETLKNRWGTEALFVPPGSGTGRGALHNTGTLPLRLFRAWGRVTSSLGWYSNTASNFAVNEVFGTRQAGMDPSLLSKSRLIVLWGYNPRDTRFGSFIESALTQARDRGTPIWVIDPRKTASVKSFNARWIPILPGSDAVLMAAMLYEVLRQGWADRSFLDRYTHGFPSLEEHILGKDDGIPKSPGWAAPHCGIPEETIRQMAREYAQTSPAALLPGLSIQRVSGGEEAYRLAAALQAATGNTGRAGGSSGVCIWNGLPIPGVEKISPDTGPEPFRLPINLWVRAALGRLAPREKQWQPPAPLKGYYGVGNNYFLQSSDMNATRRALEQMDLMVVHDLFLTPTAAMADYVLPATHFLEREDLITGNDNYLFYSRKILDPPGEALDDFEILRRLSTRLGLEDPFTGGKTAGEWLEEIVTTSAVEDPGHFRFSGIYRGERHDRMGLEAFLQDPEGHPLATGSGLIHFDSPAYRDWNFPAHPSPRPPEAPPGFSLRLVTPHHRLLINSQNANLAWVSKKEVPGIRMHPADAAARGIREGDAVKVTGETGELITPVRLTDEVSPGVTWMTQGSWSEGEQVNRLTSDESTYPSGGSRTHLVWIDIQRAREAGGKGDDH